MKRPILLCLLWVSLLATGCATLESPFRLHLEAPSAQVRECAAWYAALDEAVEAAGVRDAQAARIAGFPYLRVDRAHAALRERAAQSAAAYAAFVERLGELDLAGRSHEIRNLPQEHLDRLPGFDARPARTLAVQRTRDCARLLRELDLVRPRARALLLQRATVPDEYSSIARLVGLYPLTQFGLAAGIKSWEARARAAFAQPRDTVAPAVRYAPPAADIVSRRAVAGLLARERFDPLGQVQLSERELAELAVAYAPSFEIPVAGDYDRFGELRWGRDVNVPEVGAAEPTVYVHAAHMRYGESVLLQLVYTIWFPERPSRGALDYLAGRLDGITWRVTLDHDGEPLLYDSIHPCGCYHLFFLTPRARLRPAPGPLEEWALVPLSLPRIADGERPVLRLESATHYIEGVAITRGADSLTRYRLRWYDELRSLPRPDGGHRSAFGPDGLIAGTERLERWFLWPAGIPSAGAMRQWGKHATAFVGRRHFDDADLIERRFELDLGEGK